MKKFYLLIVAFLFFSEENISQISGITSYSCTIPTSGSMLSFKSAIAIDNSGNKWIGFNSGTTSSFQLIRYNGVAWDTFPHIPNRKVNALAVDVANNLWIASNGGLIMFNGSVFTYYNKGNSNIPSDTIISLTCGGGNIYAGTNHGLAVFNGTTFTNYNHATNGLSHDTIYSITYESSSVIWLGNLYGLEKFNGSTFTFLNLGGIGSDKINCIYIDQQNNKWLGTNAHGVVKFDNLNFFTMQQMFNQYTVVGGYWPLTTYSICRGPNGGVAFLLWADPVNSIYGTKGLLELVNNQINLYTGVGYGSSGTSSIFCNEISSNKIFFINPAGPFNPKIVFYDFDINLYNNPFTIQQGNSEYLDINNVATLISSNNDMGWDGGSTKYFVPKNKNSSPIKASSLWMGGWSNGQLRIGAMTYRQSGLDFWPGPVDTINASSDTLTSLAYNKVWKVNRYDIANFIYNWNAGNVQNGTYIPTNSILTWPAHGTGNQSHNLAPYVDVNSNGIYDPIHEGDYPLIKGDQMIWRVFNDVTGKHGETAGANMGLQVNASAYAFVCPNITDSNKVINNTTFYNFKITNYSPDRLDSFYIAPWIDSDLGNYLDDYIGCDVTNNYGFTYNGDNYDDDMNGMTGYHTNIPVFSCNILSGPLADAGDGRDNNNNGIIDEVNEKCMMHGFTYYTNTGNAQTGNPSSTGNGYQYHNFMNSQWKDGTYMTYGANGTVPTNAPCRHMFPGISDPYGISLGGSASNPITPPGNYGSSGWTQFQVGVSKNDMRFLIGVGPFTMQPGVSYELDYALVFSQDSVNCDSNSICVLTRAQQDNIRVKNWFNNNTFPTCLSLAGVGIKENTNQSWQVNVYPNPASNYVFIEFTESFEKITVEVYDMLGKIVKAGTFNEARKYIAMPIDDLANGMYSIKIRSGNKLITKKFVKE